MACYKPDNSPYYHVRFMFQGKMIRRSTKTTSVAIAKRLEAKWRNELLKKGMLDEREKISLYEVFDLYLASKKKTKSYKSLQHRISMLKRYFSNVSVDTLQQKDLEIFAYQRTSEGTKPNTVRIDIVAMRGVIKHVDKLGYQAPHIEEYPKVKVNNKRIRFLSMEEEQRLLQELDPNRVIAGGHSKHVLQDNYDFVVLLIDTGARCGELSKLIWKDVNLKDKTIRVWREKTSSESILHMTDRAYTTLKRRYQARLSDKWVFTKKDHPNQHRPYLYDTIKRALKRAGLGDVRIHDFRATFASRLVQRGMSLQEVSILLGHTKATMTERYAALIPSDASKKAVQILNNL